MLSSSIRVGPRRPFARSLLGATLTAALLAASPAAHAQGPDTAPAPTAAEKSDAKARAQKHFERGIAAYKEGRFKDAIDAFLDAHRDYPSPTLSFNAARAYEKMGDNTGALRFYREYLRQATQASDRPFVEGRISELEKTLQERGIQQVTVLSNVEGATVIIDGRPVGVAPWTGEILPGRHTFVLKREGYKEATGEFELLAHRSLDVAVSMETAPAEAAPPSAPAPQAPVEPVPKSEPPTAERSPQIGVPTWIAFGVGAAALGGAAVFEAMRAGSEDDVKNEKYQVDRWDANDRMESQQTTARILAGVGAVGIVVGGVLLYFDLSKSSERAPSSAMGLGCTPAGCAATVRGRF